MSQDQLVRFWLAGMIVAAVVGAFVPTIIEYTTEQYTSQQYVTVSDERVREIVREEVVVPPSVTKEYVDQRVSEFGQRADAQDADLARRITDGDSALLAKVNGGAARVDVVAQDIEQTAKKAATASREASSAMRRSGDVWLALVAFVLFWTAIPIAIGINRRRKARGIYVAEDAGQSGLSAQRPRRGDSDAAGPSAKGGR